MRQSPTVERSDSGQRFPQSLSHGFAEVMERNELARRASFRSSNIYVIFVKSKSLELRDEFQTVFVVKYANILAQMQTKSILLLTVGLAAGLLEPGITFIKKPVNRRIAVVTPVLAAAANLFPSPALAKGSSIPSHLASYGLPPPPPLPKGFSQILKPYGRTPNRVTKLVQFAGVSHSTPLHSTQFPVLVSFAHSLTRSFTQPQNLGF